MGRDSRGVALPRIGFSRNLGYRADQAGLLVSATNVPLTFQRTLMKRPLIDQALVTGLSIAANHAVVALAQESVQAAALILRRQARLETEDAGWSRTTIALDVGAVGLGIAVQRAFRQRHREPLVRAGARTTGYWLTVTGTAGAVIGGLQEVIGSRSRRTRGSLPVVVPAAAVLAGLNAVRVRRSARADHDASGHDASGHDASGQSTVPPAKALALGAAVAASTSLMALAERVLANGVSRGAARVLPGRREVLRPLGHAAALAMFAAAARVLVEHAFRSIEHEETAVEAAFDVRASQPLGVGELGECHPVRDALSGGTSVRLDRDHAGEDRRDLW